LDRVCHARLLVGISLLPPYSERIDFSVQVRRERVKILFLPTILSSQQRSSSSFWERRGRMPSPRSYTLARLASLLSPLSPPSPPLPPTRAFDRGKPFTVQWREGGGGGHDNVILVTSGSMLSMVVPSPYHHDLHLALIDDGSQPSPLIRKLESCIYYRTTVIFTKIIRICDEKAVNWKR
jgi:hypothetical protein